MRNLLDFIKESLVINEEINEKDIKFVEWGVHSLAAFLEEIGIDAKDIEIFVDSNSNNDTIKEYSMCINNSEEFDGLQSLENYRKYKLIDFDIKALEDKLTKKYVPRDTNLYWVDSGNGLRTIIMERFEELAYYNVFGELDLHYLLEEFDDDMTYSVSNLGFVKDTIKK